MTSRERILNAVRSLPVDHVPFSLDFWAEPRHPRAVWSDERERLAFYRRREWDTTLDFGLEVRPLSEVGVEVSYETQGEQQILRQVWHTPAGRIQERMRVTPDWPGLRTADNPVAFLDDFRPSRYIEFPFKTRDDLKTLPYLFPLDKPGTEDRLAKDRRATRALAEEFDVAIMAGLPTGMDWLIWLFPPEEIIMRAQTEPEFVGALLDHINRAYERHLELYLQLGIDACCRRGWYESTDFWSPRLFAQFARPALERQIRACRDAGCAVVYQMDSGIVPLLGELSSLGFDCLLGADPATKPLDLKTVRDGLPGKSIWGGISGPLHLGYGPPADAEQAVERAFRSLGRVGFILGMGVGFRYNWSWENLEACERAWRRLRTGS